MLLVKTFLRPSSIHGHGCFARHFIAAGTPVWRFHPCFDRALPPSFRIEFPDADWLDTYAQQCPMTGYYVIDMDEARFMNHSDTPNVDTRMPLHDPVLTHDALRDIAAGEELTCDYRIGDVAPFVGFRAEQRSEARP